MAVEGVTVFKDCNCRECSVTSRDYTSPCWQGLCSSCPQPGCCTVQGTRGVHSAGEHFSGRR